jgi:phage tail protein X
MIAKYRTKAGDILDDIVKKYYGSTQGRIVEQVLDVNPGLADNGPTIPEGVLIVLPEVNISTSGRGEGINLWD